MIGVYKIKKGKKHIILGLAFIILVFAGFLGVVEYSDALVNFYGTFGPIVCDGKSDSTYCWRVWQSGSGDQIDSVEVLGSYLEGHGGSGGGHYAVCITWPGGTMWTGACRYVWSGYVGDGQAFPPPLFLTLGGDWVVQVNRVVQEWHANEATWDDVYYDFYGRILSNVTINVPSSAIVGGPSFQVNYNSSQGYYSGNSVFGWTTSPGNVSCDKSNGQAGNASAGIATVTCTCITPGNVQFGVDIEGPGVPGPIWGSANGSVNCVNPDIPPPGPFNLNGDCNPAGGGTNRADLWWTSSTNAIAYDIYGRQWSGGSWAYLGTTGGTTWTGFPLNTIDIYYSVDARNAEGEITTSSPPILISNSTPLCSAAPEADIRCNGSGTSCPTTISYNGTATIEWCGSGGGRHNCTNAGSCVVTGTGAGAGNPPDTLSGNWMTPNLTNSVTYDLSCTGSGGTTPDSVTVNVAPPPPETVDLRCDGSGGSCTINSGNSSTISWTSSNVTSCSVSPGSFTPGPSNTGQSTGVLTSNTTYSITCDGGIATDSVTVNVIQPTIDSFQCNGSYPECTIPFNGIANITWATSTAVTSCSFMAGLGSGTWSGTSGSKNTPNLTSDEIYTISCSPGPVADSITVRVNPPPPPDFNVDFGLSSISTNPSVSSVSVTEPNYCISGPLFTTTWSFSDPGGDSFPSGSQIQVATDAGFTTIIHDSCTPSGAPPDGTCNPANNSTTYVSPVLSFNTTYYLRVRSWNSVSDPSNYTNMSSCTGPGCIGGTRWATPVHAYPQTNFNANPSGIPQGSTVQFTDATIFAAGSSGRTWSWTFSSGTPGSATGQGPHNVTYNVPPGSYQATLTASDNAGSCALSGPIYVQQGVPKWKEVAPR